MSVVGAALAQRQREGRPVRVALVGAGFMGRALLRHVETSVPGMQVVVVVNRTLHRAREAWTAAGADEVREVDVASALDRARAAGVACVSAEPGVVAADCVDVVVEATGAVEHGAHVVSLALAAGKHVVLLNAELDATVGPLLRCRAQDAGVVLTGCAGDQPGVQMDLVRFVEGLGARPLVCGNVKGLQDRFRTPTTQAAFAERWGQDPHMVTSFADGTKVNVEQALVANATGMTVPRRGMLGRDHAGHVDELVHAYEADRLEADGGWVDYVVGSRPGPGVFVLATHDDPFQRHYLELYKLGTGPLYSFYAPYHLCHLEVPTSIARAALFHDATIAAAGAPQVDVVAVAKTDLAAGQVLDGLGGYLTYGEAERADVTAAQRLLPVGVAEGARVLRDVGRDEVLSYDDVELPPGRLIDQLRDEQARLFRS